MNIIYIGSLLKSLHFFIAFIAFFTYAYAKLSSFMNYL